MAVLVAVETVVLLLLTLLVAGLLRSHAEILRRLHEMGAGVDLTGPDATRAPGPVALRPRGDAPDGGRGFAAARDVGGTGLHDDAIVMPVTGVAHRTLLAFLSSGCLTCRTFWDAFVDPDALQLPSDVRLIAVTKDAGEESLSTLRELAPADLPVVMASAAWEDYAVPGSPYFVLVDGPAGRVVGEGTGASWDQVRGLMAQATADDADATTEARIDRELLAHGIAPGDPSLSRSAEDIARDATAGVPASAPTAAAHREVGA